MTFFLNNMNQFKILKIDNIIFDLLRCWLIIDTLNGFLLRSGLTSISVSQIYKLSVFLIVVIRCKDNAAFRKSLFAIFIYLSLYSSVIVMRDEILVDSLVLVSKCLTSLSFFVYFLQIKKSNPLFFQKKGFEVLKWSFLVFSINMVLGTMGLGFKSYGGVEGFGSRGFFYAINELSGVLAVLFPWALYYCKTHFSTLKYLLASGGMFFLSFTLSTKSGIIATLLFILFIMYAYGNKKEKSLVCISLLVLLASCMVIIQIILESDIPLIQRFNYFMEKSDFVTALTSSRLEYWKEEGTEFFNAGLIGQIFGLGGSRTVEMDPFDALLNCGFVGVIFLLYMYAVLLLRPTFNKYTCCKYNKVILISNILLIIMSIGGGHVIFSSMAGMLIALSNALLIDNRKELFKKRMLKLAIAKKIMLLKF